MKKVSIVFHRSLCFSLILIGIIILFFTLFTYRRISYNLSSQSHQMMLNQVKTIKESISSIVDETTGRVLSIMTLMEEDKISKPSRIKVLDVLIDSVPECRRIWIYQRNGLLTMDSGTNQAYLDDSSWWTPLKNKIENQENKMFQGQYSVSAASEHPFRDVMGLNTIYPLSFSLLTGINITSMAFIEFDLTNVLMAKMREFHLVLMERTYPLEFSIYDKLGILLETSTNIPRSSVPINGTSPSDSIRFGDKRFLTGPIFVEDKSNVLVYVRDTNLGLVFRGALPKEAITNGASQTAGYILVIGAFCLLAVLVLGLVLLHTYKKMKHYEETQALARFQSLQNKMNPHFLFNTLDSMVGVAEKKDFSALLDMLRYLSNILHMNLRITKNIIPLTDEIHYIESYIELQRIRYKGMFSFELQLIIDIGSHEILRFCLQPIVENCFVHAVSLHKGYISISLRISRSEDFLICEITNSGTNSSDKNIGLLKEKLNSGWRDEKTPRLGLMSIHRRLRILYGDKFGIEIPESSADFSVRVILPVLT